MCRRPTSSRWAGIVFGVGGGGQIYVLGLLQKAGSLEGGQAVRGMTKKNPVRVSSGRWPQVPREAGGQGVLQWRSWVSGPIVRGVLELLLTGVPAPPGPCLLRGGDPGKEAQSLEKPC